MLSDTELATFVREGFIALRGAVPQNIIDACRREIEEDLRSRGIDVADPMTWKFPVVRLACPETPVFQAAGSQPVLWTVYDQLLPPDRWWRRTGVGGTIPVRFPHDEDPGDAGWHIEGSFEVEGDYWVNVRSRERGLLVLFLLSDVGVDDAPTELKVGSHLDIPPLLSPHGEQGRSVLSIAQMIPATTFARESAFATGRSGDVFICHPFLVHRATWPHRGVRPRYMAQPAVTLLDPFALDGLEPCPVEQAILMGLGGT
jgi:hypothetical protein